MESTKCEGGGRVLIREKNILPRTFSFMSPYLAAREARGEYVSDRDGFAMTIHDSPARTPAKGLLAGSQACSVARP